MAFGVEFSLLRFKVGITFYDPGHFYNYFFIHRKLTGNDINLQKSPPCCRTWAKGWTKKPDQKSYVTVP